MGIRHRKRNPAAWILLAIVVLTGILFSVLERNLQETSETLAEYYSRNTAAEAMTQGIEEVVGDFQGTPLVHITETDEGEIRAVQVDVQAVNLFKIEVTEKILENLQQAGRNEIKIPIGTLLGSSLFSGRGPSLHYRFLPEGSVSTRILSSFEACGINQTRHQLLLSVEVQAGAILSRYQVQVDAPTEYVLAETILVGETPQNYTQVLTDSKELLGDINDYKASDSLEISANP